MNEMMEIEYKLLLTKEIYYKIYHDYKERITCEYIQTNYYFTHPLLLENHYMLRIREKNNQYEMTLKRPYHDHNIETNVKMSEEERDMFINHLSYTNEIIQILTDLGIKMSEVKQQFSLTTHRVDIPFKEGILSLDENTYLQKEDYELEFEVYSKEEGYEKLLEIIQPYHLQYTKNCPSKIKRVLDYSKTL